MQSPTLDLQFLATRLERLEGQNRLLKLVWAATLIVLLAWLGFEIRTRSALRLDTIVTTHLVLQDKAGREGAELSFGKDGKAELHLFDLGDDHGTNATLTAANLELHFHGSSTSLSDGGLFMFDGKGNQIIGLGGPLEAAPALNLWGSDRRRIWLSALEPNATIGISDEEGFEASLGSAELVTTRTGEKHKTSAASLMLFGKDKKVLWSAP